MTKPYPATWAGLEIKTKRWRMRDMLNVVDRMYLTTCCRLGYLKKRIAGAWQEMKEDEKGSTATVVIEIVMIGMVLVLGFMFREKIGKLFVQLWNNLVKFGDDPGEVSIENMSNPFE